MDIGNNIRVKTSKTIRLLRRTINGMFKLNSEVVSNDILRITEFDYTVHILSDSIRNSIANQIWK